MRRKSLDASRRSQCVCRCPSSINSDVESSSRAIALALGSSYSPRALEPQPFAFGPWTKRVMYNGGYLLLVVFTS